MYRTSYISLTQGEIIRAEREYGLEVEVKGYEGGGCSGVLVFSETFFGLFHFLRSIVDFKDYTDEQIEEYYIKHC